MRQLEVTGNIQAKYGKTTYRYFARQDQVSQQPNQRFAWMILSELIDRSKRLSTQVLQRARTPSQSQRLSTQVLQRARTPSQSHRLSTQVLQRARTPSQSHRLSMQELQRARTPCQSQRVSTQVLHHHCEAVDVESGGGR